MGGLLKIEQVAARLAVSGRTVQRMIERGEVRVFRRGGVVRVWTNSLDAHLQRHSTGGGHRPCPHGRTRGTESLPPSTNRVRLAPESRQRDGARPQPPGGSITTHTRYPSARTIKTEYRNIRQRHSRACGLSAGRRRCSGEPLCCPVYEVRVGNGPGKPDERTFTNIDEALAWRNARRAIRAGKVPEPAETVGASLRAELARFERDCKAGRVLNRSSQPYREVTWKGYVAVIRNHALEHPDPGLGAVGDLPAQLLVERPGILQGMVRAVQRDSPTVARLAGSAVNAVLTYCFERRPQGVTKLPERLRLPPAPNPRTRTLPIDTVPELLRLARADDVRFDRCLMEPLIGMHLAWGQRISETLRADWGPGSLDLSTTPLTLTVRDTTTKTRSGQRVLVAPSWLDPIVRRYWESLGRPSDGSPVFVGRTGKRMTRSGAVRSGLERIGKAAGIPRLGTHLLRHSQGTWLDAAGATLEQIQRRLGHADRRFTEATYVHRPAVQDQLVGSVLEGYLHEHGAHPLEHTEQEKHQAA